VPGSPVKISRRDGAKFEDIAHLASGKRGREEVLQHGNMENGLWWAGQSQGLIHEVASCQEVVDTIMNDARNIILEKLLPKADTRPELELAVADR
jgi:NAD(P)H-dependent flavin oxidoreductase YrpB (nitropropane dioxygenase family)